MFDMSWSELLLIAVVGLIVIGPKDLPKVVRTVMQFAQKARSMAREFQSGVEEMAREAELHEIKTSLEKDVSENFAEDLEHSIDPGGKIGRSLDVEDEDASATPTPALPAIEADGAESPTQPQTAKASLDSKDPIFLDAEPAAEPETAKPAAPPAGESKAAEALTRPAEATQEH